MKIITHGGKFSYEVNNLENTILLFYRDYFTGKEIYSGLLPVVTGKDIVALFTTNNDLFLLATSDSEKVVYTYTINQSTGELIPTNLWKTTLQGIQDLLNRLNKGN